MDISTNAHEEKTYMEELKNEPSYKCSGKQFLKDVENHSMKIVNANGNYRHIRFADGYCRYYDANKFELITWDWCLCISSERGTYLFSYIVDMFDFFEACKKDKNNLIDPGYWTEKLKSTCNASGHKEYNFEYGCRDNYAYDYIWCLHAIVWGIKMFRNSQ